MSEDNRYRVHEVAAVAGITPRTLHHYDRIGLLTPSHRAQNGYRHYGTGDLYRLQQILFFRELGLTLKEIGKILDDPAFDPKETLSKHKEHLQPRMEQLQRLIATVEKTLRTFGKESETMNPEELYEGFENGLQYRDEARQRYGAEKVDESEQRLGQLSPAQWQNVKEEGRDITVAIAALMDRGPDDKGVQEQIDRYYQYLQQFSNYSLELFRGLGQLYVDDARFTAFYDKVKPGLADFMRIAMGHYADKHSDTQG